MQEKLAEFINKTIIFLYFALAIVTPLLFTTITTELYEVPKMFVVYFAAVLILFLTIAKFIMRGKIELPKNLVLISLILLLLSQILSTITSIDKYTSVFGFPSRLNGGVLSLFAYIIIFACAQVNFSKIDAKKLLMTLVFTALAVSLWGIPGHFDRDPSCLVLTGQLTSGCWQKEFNPKTRIFSTLGQPNWLASYLVILLPISLVFILYSKRNSQKYFFAITSVVIFWAIILTNSRSGLLGMAASLILLTLLLSKNVLFENLKFLLPTAIAFAVIVLAFRTGIVSRTQEFAPPTIQPSNHPTVQPSTPTDSSQIRLIVWKGAIDVFKKWPILGTGPETFVSSYYFVRPLTHNQTSEWEFYYNKAHNEFLNYLANTGILGFIAYVAFVAAALLALLKNSPSKPAILEGVQQPIESFSSSHPALRGSNNNESLLAKATLAGFIGYQATIFFGFSTVVTQVAMFLTLAAVLKITSKESSFEFKLQLPNAYKTSLLLLTSVVGLFTLTFVARLAAADIFQKRADAWQGENLSKVLTSYQNSIKASPVKNPYLLADFSYILATAVDKLQDSENYAKKAEALAKEASAQSPSNFLVLEKSTKAYIALSTSSNNYYSMADNFGQRLTEIAPTYPPAFLTKAKADIVVGKEDAAKADLQKALELKPEYLDAQELLGQLK